MSSGVPVAFYLESLRPLAIFQADDDTLEVDIVLIDRRNKFCGTFEVTGAGLKVDPADVPRDA